MLNSFSAKSRTALLQQLDEVSFDVLVIGGGITGAGIALDAASRGLKVGLIEMQDFAAGTSSRSTKLIHGGLRYLKQLEFKLVAEVGKEREIIHRNAPHLTRPDLMLLPITKNGSFGKFTTQLGMWVYEFLAGVKREERHRVLSAIDTTDKEPLLKKETLEGGILYYEYRTDDARLTISVLKEAVSRGALALSYLKATGFIYEQGKIKGVEAEDQLNKRLYKLHATYVVNASGPWVDELDSLDDKSHANKLQLTKGVHLVVDHQKLPVRQSVYFDTYDKRMMFVIPRDGKTYLGTTDTFYNGDKLNPLITDEDKAYVLKCINDYFAGHSLTLSDLESGWAGIRPLIMKPGKKPSEISRKDETFVWDSGLITIAGGKLTGYRKMAQRIVDLIAKKIEIAGQKKLPACSTDHILLSGGKLGSMHFPEFIKHKIPAGITLGLSYEVAEKLLNRYGSETDMLYEIMKALKETESPNHDLPLWLRGEIVYAIEYEMCLTPSDFFIRRTGMLYFDIDSVKSYRTALINYMKGILQWDSTLTEYYDKELQQAILNVQ
jgi:glycerol-3-phosphate dehydrogenase